MMDGVYFDCGLSRLDEMVVGLVEEIIDQLAAAGADGIFDCEDWGTQSQLLVSPTMWRQLFLPTFERVASRAHAHGLSVWLHSCGYLWEIIPDLIVVLNDFCLCHQRS